MNTVEVTGRGRAYDHGPDSVCVKLEETGKKEAQWDRLEVISEVKRNAVKTPVVELST